ncbi:MAG: LysM domain-containing protein [Pseudomonadota bacterium]
MTNPIQAMFEAGIVEATDFPPESRYSGLPTKTLEGPDGRVITYVTRRFVPQPEAFATQAYRVVTQGERLDHVAASAIGNPEGFWQMCDANGALFAEELEVAGREVRLTLPEGVPGPEEEL